jgi:hypothetical protein
MPRVHEPPSEAAKPIHLGAVPGAKEYEAGANQVIMMRKRRRDPLNPRPHPVHPAAPAGRRQALETCCRATD